MSNTIELVFIGASNAFLEVSDIIASINKIEQKYDIIALLDDNVSIHGQEINGIKVVGGLERAKEFPTAKFIFGIGSLQTRLIRHKIFKKLQIPEERFETIIHPSANVDSTAKIGYGCIIHPGVCIGSKASIEDFTVIAVNTAIGPYVRIGKYSMITTLVAILTGVKIGKSVFIGTSSCIAENVKIGSGAMIGIGTIISRDIQEGAFVLGNPARIISSEIVPIEISVDM